MDYTSATITLIIMFMMVILLIGVIYSRLHWTTKSGFIITSLVCACVSFLTFRAALGWPVSLPKAPTEFQFVYGTVREPLVGNGDRGAIYIWMIEPGQKQPRSVQIPYSRETHKKIEQAKKRVAEGKTVYMKAGQSEDENSEEAATKRGKVKPGKMKGKPTTDGPEDDSESAIDFVEPPSTLPEKD